MKIDQSIFIKDLVIKKSLTDYNAIGILMKTSLAIDMFNTDDYKKTTFYKYQRLIGRLIYLICETRPNIIFVVGQLSKYNANLKKSQFKTTKKVVQYLKDLMQSRLIYE